VTRVKSRRIMGRMMMILEKGVLLAAPQIRYWDGTAGKYRY
jgi:hypothetical protein